MKVTNLTPNAKVAEYVERILVLEDLQTLTPFSLPLFANGSPTLLFTSAKGRIGNKPAAHLILFGQTILPETLAFTGPFVLIAYFFKPYSLHSLFGVSALELTDKPIDLDLLASKRSAALRERLMNTPSTKTRIAFLDHYIAGLIANANADNPIIKYTTHKIVQDPSRAVLPLIQKDLHLTERTFQRIFEKNIGIAPNLYKRICQFNTAFQQLNNRAYEKLSDIAFTNGYSDQSHYIRSFKEFTGITPGDYLDFGTKKP